MKNVLAKIGYLVLIFGVVCAFTAIWHDELWLEFLLTAVGCMFIGPVLISQGDNE